MKISNLLIGISHTLMTLLLIGGLSACVPKKTPTISSKNETAIDNIIIEKTTASNTEEIQTPTDLHQPAASLENGACPLTPNDSSYRLGAEDEIDIKIFGEKELSNKYIIQNSGTVNIPLIGETVLSGCTLRQTEQLLFTKFTDGYLINPSISVAISKHRPFYILGEVRTPGRYDYIIDMNVLQAVAIAGGFTKNANKKKAEILERSKNNEPVYKNLLIEQKIHPGDIIFIKEGIF